MNWNYLLKEYRGFLKLEKNASAHTLDAYLNDIGKLQSYSELQNPAIAPLTIERRHIENFLAYLYENFSIQESSQARILSGIKSFFNFLIYQNYIQQNPAELIDAPKLIRKLPDTLSFEEIEAMINSIDVSRTRHER